MPDELLNLRGQALAAEILMTIDDARPSRGVALSALAYCRNQFENRTIVETAVLVSGCRATNFFCNEDLELYYDIAKNGGDVAYISKGWDDPGFRLGETITIAGSKIGCLEEAKRFCDTNGVVLSFTENEESDYEVMIEQLIYSTGFDGLTFAKALSTLVECSERLKRC